MSSSSNDKRKRAEGSLEIVNRAGVTWRVRNGEDTEVARGTGDTTLTLTEGIYAVEWISAGIRSEDLIRVLANDEPAVVRYTPAAPASVASIAPVDAAKLIQQVEGSVPSHKDHGSAIVVITTSASGGAVPLKAVRLYNERDVAMRADPEAEPRLELQQGDAARYYNVPPGSYLLSFVAVTGETMQQTVPVLPGRRTFVFCEGSNANVLVAAGQGFEQITRAGIEPTRTVIVSVVGDEADERIRERVRLARVLLHDIARGESSIDDALVGILSDAATDPLLRLLGAVIVVARLERRQSPRAGEAWPRRGVVNFRCEWTDRALAWLRFDKAITIGPDDTVLRWKLGKPGANQPRIKGRRSISRPPMLAQVWRWAVAASVTDPGVIEQSAPIIAAARSAGGTEPWLCWKASAAKAAPAALPPETQSASGLEQLAASAIVRSREIAAIGLDTLFTQLTPEVGVTALHMSAGKDLADLAVSLGLPADGLSRRLLRTSREIDALFSDAGNGQQINSRSSAITSPTAVSRPILFPDDPQKGRFGGLAESNGYRISAQFFPTRKAGWTRVSLTITGPADDGKLAQFYLHDSFAPSVKDSFFAKGRAKLEVTSWGGFTVGVWIPAGDIELELDLAQLSAAPEPIQTR